MIGLLTMLVFSLCNTVIYFIIVWGKKVMMLIEIDIVLDRHITDKPEDCAGERMVNLT